MAATNAALALGGMTHCCLSKGLVSFFERPPGRRRGDRFDDFHLHQPIGQQHHRPAGTALGRLGAGQCDELSLLPAVELTVLTAGRTLAVQCGLQAFRHELVTHPPRRHTCRVKGLGDPLVGPSSGPFTSVLSRMCAADAGKPTGCPCG